MTFSIRQNDSSPALRATLRDGAGDVVDLTSATVTAYMASSEGVLKIDGATVTVNDAAGGDVTYNWEPADTDTVGRFSFWFRVTFADTTVETFPNRGRISVIIEDDPSV